MNQPLVIDLSGPQGQALLAVSPPSAQVPKAVEFDVVPLGDDGGRLRRITTQVVFTSARNQLPGWPAWHVKIYRCADLGDAEMLRRHLHRQAVALQRANSCLPGPDRRTPVAPPWAVVPVQVVRGDGRPEEVSGAVTTRLGAPPDQVLARLRATLPPWFGDPALPDLLLLAVSPQIESLSWEAHRTWPGTEQLPDFAQLAAGLDQLHSSRWVHCDIKPDNVCWCTTQGTRGYVLIDTDAATRADPPPATLRGTARYEHRRIRALRGVPADDWDLTPGMLYAQDRFGFLTVVLSALAGRDWVDGTLLAPDPDQPDERVADSADGVLRALRAHWPDQRWEPLIRVLAEPFGDGTALESPEPWAAGWLARTMAAERLCGRRSEPAATVEPRRPFAAEIARIRAHARQGPARRQDQMHRAYEAIERGAQAVALRRAVVWATGWSTMLMLVTALISVGSAARG